MILLFVCAGNTCRSPLAVAAWERWGVPLLCDSAWKERVRAVSAGISAREGAPVSRHAAIVARDWNADISAHHAAPLSRELARRADWIFAMTPEQCDAARRLAPRPERVRLLGEYASLVLDEEARRLARLLSQCEDAPTDAAIADPVGGTLEAYEACASQIRASVEGVARALREGRLQ
jgi:protein-tyrosine-phosphatase